MDLARLRRQSDRLRSELRASSLQEIEDGDAVASILDRIGYLEEAQVILQSVAQAVQERVHGRISGIVSKCLSALFDDPYEFEVIFERKRGRTEAKILFKKDGHEVDPLSAAGGGVVDVAAFALRLADILLARPPRRRVLVLDEPFRFLKPMSTYGPRIFALLKSLAEELGVQFIMVTHEPELKFGKIVNLEESNDG